MPCMQEVVIHPYITSYNENNELILQILRIKNATNWI
jgi:hypothetical protein